MPWVPLKEIAVGQRLRHRDRPGTWRVEGRPGPYVFALRREEDGETILVDADDFRFPHWSTPWLVDDPQGGSDGFDHL